MTLVILVTQVTLVILVILVTQVTLVTLVTLVVQVTLITLATLVTLVVQVTLIILVTLGIQSNPSTTVKEIYVTVAIVINRRSFRWYDSGQLLYDERIVL